MVARGITPGLVEDAVKKGSKTIQAPDKLLHHFRYFVVVTKKIKQDIFVITVKPRW